MKGVNKCIFIGTVGKDPDVRFTQSGSAVAGFSIAVNEKWKDKQTGEQKERTEWINVSAFGKLAEIIQAYVTKGTVVYVEGKMRTEKYQDKQTGQDKYATKIQADTLQMLGGGQQQARPQNNQQAYQAQNPQQNNDLTDDDFPF